MRRSQAVGVLAIGLFVLILGPAAGQEPTLDDADPAGKPTAFKAGLSPRYVVWQDKDGWHVRVTTNKAKTTFSGRIEPVGGKIAAMGLDSGGKAPPKMMKIDSKAYNLKLTISKGLVNGMDLQFEDTVTAVKFALKVDDAEDAEVIFIGAKGAHPKGATFALPAKPEKK
jgi:hypothetical protein